MTIETANRLYELRKKKGLSQEELAEKLGVSRQAVSKWERSEASPDTDNMIALAKIYELSLDELIFGEKETKEEKSEDRKNGNKVNIGPSGIYVETDDGDKVQINLKGIQVTEGNHIHINSDDDDDFDDEEILVDKETDGHYRIQITKPRHKAKFWFEIPYPIICTALYLLFGFLDICGGWALSWIIFITIPIYYTLVEAIYKKRVSEFAYPIFAALAYLYMGLYHGNWHPSWLVFLTIPVYYSISNAIDRKIKSSEIKYNQ